MASVNVSGAKSIKGFGSAGGHIGDSFPRIAAVASLTCLVLFGLLSAFTAHEFKIEQRAQILLQHRQVDSLERQASAEAERGAGSAFRVSAAQYRGRGRPIEVAASGGEHRVLTLAPFGLSRQAGLSRR